MKKFDDEEKKLDRMINLIHVSYQKFLNKDTCPTCNIPKILAVLRDTSFSEAEIKKRKWIHNVESCFKWYAGLMLSLKKDKTGKYLSEERLQELINHSFNILTKFDRKYKEGLN